MTLLDLTTPTQLASRLQGLPVAIIGAGPIGLATAANLTDRGIDFVLLEAGDRIGSSIEQWGHIRLFSPWKHLVDPVSRRLLAETDWAEPPAESLPTGAELVRDFLTPLADPVRLRLVSIVAASEGQEACVCDLIEPVGLSQPTVSHHLKILTEAGFLSRSKRGTWAYYRLVPGALDAAAAPLVSV